MSKFTPYLVTPPAAEPITLAEARRHLRLDGTEAEPDPYTAATVALAGAGAGNVNNGAHRYAVSWVTADGETLCGPASLAATVADKTTNGKVALSNIPTGGSAVIARNIYRTVAGGTDYLLLAQIADNTTTTYTDNIADASLGVGEPVTNTTADADVVQLITLARQQVERHTNMALITQTWDFKADNLALNKSGDLSIPMRPLQSVTSISYTDLNGTTQALDLTIYEISNGTSQAFPRISPTFGNVMPNVYKGTDKATIRAVMGFGATGASVPAELRQAIKLVLGHFYANREASIVGVTASELPMGYKALITPYKALSY